MGTVYLAHDPDLDRDVALKLLNAGGPHYSSADRSLREARAAAAIRHPSISTIHEVGTDDQGRPYIVMEYCEGVTLSTLIRRREITLDRFLRIARQIAAGLAAAHRSGIIHRDIKSSNVLVSDDDAVKILDFGLARVVTAGANAPTSPDASTASSFFGTVPYISPEQAAGMEPDIRSDLFSTGVVLYEMASGKLPFSAENPLMLLEMIREEEPAPLESANFPIGPELARVIARLLQKHPADRYQSADALVEDLAALDEELDRTRAQTSRRSYRLLATRRRSVWLVPGATAILAIVLLVFGVWFGDFFRETPVAGGPIESVAVLPLTNLAVTEGDEFLSVGFADALITKLQQVEFLRVRPTASALRYGGADYTLADAADALEVDAILTGNFLSSGGRIRVSLQLVDTRSNFGVWSDTIEGNREDLIGLIDRVSDETVTALRRNLRGTNVNRTSRPFTENTKAYEHYLRARALTGSSIPEEQLQQIQSLVAATELDPEFAAAYAELAIALSLGRVRGVQVPEDLASPEWYARQAVRLDPTLPTAHVALGRTLVRQDNRFTESVREHLAALRLDPNEPQALAPVISYFVSLGDMERAQCLIDRFTSIDPSSNDTRIRGYWYINGLEPELAIATASDALRVPETELSGHDILALAHLQLGNVVVATRHGRRVDELAPGHFAGTGLRAMIAADRGERETVIKELEAIAPAAESNHYAALRAALALARVGDDDGAVARVRDTIRLGNNGLHTLEHHPWLAQLQQRQDFQQLLVPVREELEAVRDDAIGMQRLLCARSPV